MEQRGSADWFRRWADVSQPSWKTAAKQLICSSGCQFLFSSEGRSFHTFDVIDQTALTELNCSFLT